MRSISFIVLIFMCTESFCSSESKSSGSGILGGLNALARPRSYIGYGEGDFVGLTADNIDQPLPRIKSFFAGGDFGALLAVHFGFRESYTQTAQMRFNGGQTTRGEIYLTLAEVGAKLFLPIPIFEVWVGGGYIYGTGAFSNPRTRGNDNWLAIFENETHSVWGTYAHGGIDIMVGGVGLRVFYQDDYISTQRYYNLNTPGMNFNLRQVGFALTKNH